MMNSKKKNNNQKTNPKRVIYDNRNVGFSINVPNNWLEVKKSSFPDLGINDNTLFVFATDKFSTLTAVFSGFCKKRNFNKFFDKVTFSDNLKIIKTGQKEYKNVSVKYVVTEYDNKKIMHNFCLINEMIVNFTINIDPKNRLIDNKGLTTDSNFKLINDVLKTIEVYKPVNPPIYVDDERYTPKEETNSELPTKSLARIYIENDCKYKNTTIPQFYLKYLYESNNSEVLLSIINKELYFKGQNDCFRVIKVDENLSNQIMEIIEDNLMVLKEMTLTEQTKKTNGLLVIKLKDEYLYIDLFNKKINISELMNILNKIIKVISAETQKDFSNYDLLPNITSKETTNNKTQVVISDEVGKEAEIILRKLEKELLEMELLKKQVDLEKVQISDKVGKEAEEILKKVNAQIETMNAKNEVYILPNEVGHEAELVLRKLEEETSKLKEVVIPKQVGEEAQIILTKLENEQKFEEHQQGQKNREYDVSEFENFFHNIDGHASFRFLFPKNIGDKVVRDFNVFDIINGDDLIYRIFIFKCDTLEAYETKLKIWMSMNINSNQSIVKEEYNQTCDNGHEVKTYIFENGRFYKVAYIHNYLVSISGLESEESLFYADLALDHVEIGEDNKAFVESFDRKNRSIKILEAQGIPYLEELPSIESSYEVTGKTLDEIAKRAIVLCISCNFASDILSNKKRRYIKESKKFFNKLLDTYNVKDVMTKDEKTLFDKMDKKIAIQLSWQFEGYVILLWTLGLIDEITFPDTLVDPDSVTAIVSACDTYKEFKEKCNLRNVNEVLDLADLTYRYNWYCVEAKIRDEDPVINPEIVMERHRALNWLLTDAKWDKVEINT